MNIVNIPSSKGRGKQTPNRVIIHSMSEYLTDGKISYHAKEFLDKIGLSAHYLITPSGVIIQTRQNNQIAIYFLFTIYLCTPDYCVSKI